MKLRFRQLLPYDTKYMVYKLGHRARFFKLRHMDSKWRLALGFVGVVAIGSSSVAVVQPSASQVFGLVKKHASSDSRTGASGGAAVRAGSSKAPPKHSVASAVTSAAAPVSLASSTDCDDFSSGHAGLAKSSAPELRKLAQYEQLCGGAVAARSSIFVPTPATAAQAQTSAQDVAATLKAYAGAGVAPLVFMEPDDLNGGNLDLAAYANGAYDGALDAYFAALQANGITSSSMGMWVFVPEGNLPVWTTVDPAIYTAVVTKTAQFQKKYFPASQSAIMLDSESYPVGGGWGAGSYVSLVPYVQNIPKGLIDSFGLQGFPWAAPANQPANTSYNPQTYLRTDLAMQAARTLGVSNLWFNTGTFNQMYANQPGLTVTATPAQRQAMLQGVLRQAEQVRGQGFTVAIHLFAQNKAHLAEGTDWSYWQNQPGSDANTAVFTTFAHDAAAANVPLWLYDTAS